MRVLRAADYRRMPWKNGGGETAEIAVSPERAGLDEFHWRVSMARVAADGPFSIFVGIDRTLTVLEGRLRLQVGAAPPVELTPNSSPHTFPADVATESWLSAGPVLDLNVMSRRGHVRHEVERLAIAGSTRTAGSDGTVLVFSPSGGVEIQAGRDRAALGPFDSLRVDGPPPIVCTAVATATVFVIRLLQQS